MLLTKGDRIILATHNEGKRGEIAALLAPFGIAVESAAAHNLPAPEETAPDFIGNATIKSQAASLATGLPALADDSGLAIDALGGAPGIHAALWAERDSIEGGVKERDFDYAMARVEKELQAAHNKSRAAQFICALSLSWLEDGKVKTAAYEGRIEGTIISPPRGTNGFGYDPIFLPDNYEQSFGEMEPAAKHAISHRADAFAQFIKAHIKPHIKPHIKS